VFELIFFPFQLFNNGLFKKIEQQKLLNQDPFFWC